MAVAEAMAPEVNYRPAGSLRFGEHTRDSSPIPRWWVEQSGRSADWLVREGLLEETTDPVTADFFRPLDPRTANDPAPAMAEELNALRAENSRLRGENKGLAANNESLRAKEAAQTVALGEQQTAIAHWRLQAEAGRAAAVAAEKKAADLASELEMERATRPAADPPAAKKTK